MIFYLHNDPLMTAELQIEPGHLFRAGSGTQVPERPELKPHPAEPLARLNPGTYSDLINVHSGALRVLPPQHGWGLIGVDSHGDIIQNFYSEGDEDPNEELDEFKVDHKKGELAIPVELSAGSKFILLARPAFSEDSEGTLIFDFEMIPGSSPLLYSKTRIDERKSNIPDSLTAILGEFDSSVASIASSDEQLEAFQAEVRERTIKNSIRLGYPI
jgi:hypothetical protein